MIAALFVQLDGCYYIDGVDPWPEERDARKYQGPHPVVAHPPCARWSRLAKFCEVRHGLKVGADDGCFASALKSVRRYGGVIEHPAFSKAWEKFVLPRPETKVYAWQGSDELGYSAYVEQGRYGHIVKKATWLYTYGIPKKKLPELRWGYTPDSRGKISQNQDWRGGMDKWRDATGGQKQSNATPPAFRDELLRIASCAVATCA